MMRIKLKFAFGNIRTPADFIDTLNVGDAEVEIRNGVTVKRMGFNRYRFSYHGDSTEIDLNLPKDVTYDPPYPLSYHKIGRIFLLDVSPAILPALTALGIDISEVEGVFHTHAHDDHFAGLPALIQSDRRLKYFATPLVTSSVAKKFAALMSMEEDKFPQFFDIQDLEFDKWHDFDGLEVKPIFSPHPLETNMFLFRAKDGDEYRSYAHWADLSSMDVLDGMTGDEPDKVPASFMNKVKEDYLIPADLKKLDIGGGMIHGFAKDFREDKSSHLVLAHIDRKLTIEEMGIGSESTFGAVDVLIPSEENYLLKKAFNLLKEFFPKVKDEELQALLDCEIVEHNAGTILRRSKEDHGHLDMILSGTVAYLEASAGVRNHLSFGSFIGGTSLFGDLHDDAWTYRTVSHCRVIQFSTKLMQEFLTAHNLLDSMREIMNRIWFLRQTWLFGEKTTFLSLERIAITMKTTTFEAGESVVISKTPTLWLVKSGEVNLIDKDGNILETIGLGGFFGEQTYLSDFRSDWRFTASVDTELYETQFDKLLEFPIIHWKILEVNAKRWRQVVTDFAS